MSSIYPSALRIDSGRCRGEAIINTPLPKFSWALMGCGVQTACRVEVTCCDECFWDSSWVDKSEQNLRYSGKALKSGRLYEVIVSIRDENAFESRCKLGTFRTALFEGWDAPWIAPCEDFGEAAVYFERTIDLKGRKISNCVLYCCGIGYQKIKINDCAVDGNIKLAPLVSSYDKRCYFTVHSGIKELFTDNENHLQITVAQGWRRNIGPYLDHIRDRKVSFFGIPQLTAILDITFDNGDTLRITTDETWSCCHGPVIYANLFDGEVYDARIEHTSQRTYGCREVPAPGENTVMQPQELESIHVQKRYRSFSVQETENGYIFDLGQNISGVCELRLPAGFPEGTTITLTHAELLNENGDLYTAPLRGAKAKDVYISGVSNEAVTWSPEFTYHGFRYVKVEGLPFAPDRDLLSGIQFYTDIDSGSSFRCGSGLVNQIQRMIVMTERDNLHGIATDCPQRDERMGWMNDATVRFEALPYNFDVGRLFPKIIRDICDTQIDGAITCTAPYVYGERPADPVCSSFLVSAQMSWLHYGNRDIVREAYPALDAWNRCLERHSADGIVNYSYYGDWASPEDCCIGGAASAITPGIFMSTGYHYMNAKLLASFARILGKDSEAERHEKRAEYVRQAILDKWLNADGTICTGSQACQAFALRLGILPEALRKMAAAKMNDSVVKAGNRITTGNLCTLYLMEMLAEYGYINTAWEIITREAYPSWGYMLQNGATTVWERLELKEDPGMNSHCHPMYGAVGKWLYSHIIGIIPTAPGFEKVCIHPYLPDKLLSAQATVSTCKGDISVRWEKKYGETRLFVSVPSGMTAFIEVNCMAKEVKTGTYHFVI